MSTKIPKHLRNVNRAGKKPRRCYDGPWEGVILYMTPMISSTLVMNIKGQIGSYVGTGDCLKWEPYNEKIQDGQNIDVLVLS